MKTPREILLERHRAAEGKLDAIRREALQLAAEGQAASAQKPKLTLAMIPLTIWRELFLPARRIWAGLAAVWVLIFVLRVASSEPSPAYANNSQPPPSSQDVEALKSQQKLFAELLWDDTKPGDSDKPKRSWPVPHSELRRPIDMA
jgi:hypothetical protein